jgi:hypothetical protein
VTSFFGVDETGARMEFTIAGAVLKHGAKPSDEPGATHMVPDVWHYGDWVYEPLGRQVLMRRGKNQSWHPPHWYKVRLDHFVYEHWVAKQIVT